MINLNNNDNIDMPMHAYFNIGELSKNVTHLIKGRSYIGDGTHVFVRVLNSFMFNFHTSLDIETVKKLIEDNNDAELLKAQWAFINIVGFKI